MLSTHQTFFRNYNNFLTAQDSSYLFAEYLDSVQKYKQSQIILTPQRDSRPSPLLVDILAKQRVGVAPTTGMAYMERIGAEQAATAAVAA